MKASGRTLVLRVNLITAPCTLASGMRQLPGTSHHRDPSFPRTQESTQFETADERGSTQI